MPFVYWDAPTQREDGSTIPSSEIHHYVLRQTVGDDEWFYETTSTSYDVPLQGGTLGVVEVAVVDTQFITSDYYILGTSMVAYVKNANGDWNNASLWTPNGIPNSSDTVTLGTFTTTIPSGYTAQCGGITSFSGTSSGARSTLQIAGKLELYGDSNQGIWTTLSFIGTGNIDLRGNSWSIDYTDGTGLRCEVISDGTGTCEIYSSTTVGHFGGAAGGTYYGKLDLNNFRIYNTSFRYGSGWYPLNPYKLQNGLFWNCGRIENDSYIDDGEDWVLNNVMFVGSQASEDQKVWLHCRDKGGTITGTRKLENVVFDYRGLTDAIARLRYIPNITWDTSTGKPTKIYLANCYLEGVDFQAPIDKLFSSAGVVGEGGMPLDLSYFSPAVNNPHTMQNLTTHISNSVLESIQPVGSTDAGDHFIVPLSGTTLVEKTLIIDNYGAVLLNALGTPPKTGTYTLDHITYVCDQQDDGYGKAVRNENSGTFSNSSNVTVKNSIFHNRSNPSGSTTGRVFFMETSGDDQIEYVDYNIYNINSSNPSNIYYGVTSATKGTIGSQTGWGANDAINVNPNFFDQSRGIVSWAAQYGAASYNESLDYLINGILGYNPVTHTLNSGLVTGHTVDDLRSWVSDGYRPTNNSLTAAGSDGEDIGAFDVLLTTIYNIKGLGGITASGATKNSLIKVIKAVGGAVAGGSGKAYNLAGAITHIVRASGVVISSGASAIKRTFSSKASGGVSATGTGRIQALYKWAVSGAVNVLGAAKASLTKKVLPNLTAATVSGSARTQLVIGAVTYVIRGSGGVNSSGSAKSGKLTEYVIEAIGGVLSAGSALVVRGYKILASGAVSLSGKAKQLSSRGVLGTGGVVVSGGSVQGSSLDYTVSVDRLASSGELGFSIFRTLKKKTMTIKDPDNVLDYGWDFTPELAKIKDTIQTVTVITLGGISSSRIAHDDYKVSAFISGGVIGTEASATFRIVTDGGRTIDKTLYFTIQQQ